MRARRPGRLPHRRRRRRRQNRGIQLRSVTATVEGDMDVRGILGIDPDVRNGFSGIKVTLRDRRRRHAGRDRGASSPSRRSARPSSTSSPTRPTSPSTSPEPRAAAASDAMRTTTVVIGGGPGRPGDEPLPHRPRRSTTSCSSAARSANSWRTERWDSLRLLTPNWQSRLPGSAYDGDDPDGFMTCPRSSTFLDALRDDRRARRCGPARP